MCATYRHASVVLVREPDENESVPELSLPRLQEVSRIIQCSLELDVQPNREERELQQRFHFGRRRFHIIIGLVET